MKASGWPESARFHFRSSGPRETADPGRQAGFSLKNRMSCASSDSFRGKPAMPDSKGVEDESECSSNFSSGVPSERRIGDTFRIT